MALREDIEAQGQWLFKWRSYLPVMFLPILLLGLRDSGFIEKAFGYMAQEHWRFFCLFIGFIGLGVRCLTIGYVPRGTSGRNTQWQAAETLNTTGMYSVCRNPLYLGNFVIMLGVILFVQVWWFAMVALIGFWLYYERIIFAEEEFLRNKFGALFLDWAKKTPAFFPRFKNWNRPPLSFSFKTILKKEFSTFFGVIMFFTFLNVAGDLLAKGKLRLSLPWAIIVVFGITVSFTLRILKRRTKILHVHGR